MNYNTEVIKRAAQQIAEMFKSAVIAQQESGGTATIAEIEADMREALRQVGLEALGLFLSSMQATPVREILCECEGTLGYQRMREAKVISVFGKTSYKRAYYAGCTCGKGKSPLDEQFGLEPGAVTAGLAKLLALAGIAYSYDESPNWLKEYLLFEVSANTVRSETERMGALQESMEEKLIVQSQDERHLQVRQRNPGSIPTRLYGSMDAAKVRIEPRPGKGEEKEAHEDWRDLKVLCWYEVEEVSPAQRSARQCEKVARQQLPLRAKHMRYACDITEADDFGTLLWATGCTVNADLTPELVFVGDGAIWIWNLVDHYYAQAVQIVDWYHAEEHLEKVAADAFTQLPERTAWLEQTTQSLWEGQVEEVILACQTLALSSPEAHKAVTYFTNNMERMRYDQFRAAGYMIGSGTVESGCKQIVTQRLKLPGAQWEVEGAVYTAKARAAWLSGQWHALCAHRATLPFAV